MYKPNGTTCERIYQNEKKLKNFDRFTLVQLKIQDQIKYIDDDSEIDEMHDNEY